MADLVTIGASSFLAYYLRDLLGQAGVVQTLENEIPAALGVLPLWLAILYFFGCYRPQYVSMTAEAIRRFFAATGVGVLLLGFESFVFNLQLSRLYVAFLFVLVLVLGTVARGVVRVFVRRRRAMGDFLQRVLVVGSDDEAQDVVEAMLRDPGSGYVPIGYVDDGYAIGVTVADTLPVLGRPDDILDLAIQHRVGLVVISPTGVTPGTLGDMTVALEGSPVDLAVAPSLFEVVTRRVSVESVANVPLLHVEQIRLTWGKAFLKRALDLIVASVLLVVLSPVILAAGVVVRIRDGSPVFFHQERVGKDERHFTVHKFRTMVPDADERLDELAELNEAGHAFFKMRQDPRVTAVGRFLRKWSIDETPQLWNVLKGDMSMVGPRPPVPDEVVKYDAWHRRRLRVRPGITGVWQVSGRSNIEFEEAVRMDLFYIENWSLGYDLHLMAKTVLAVLGRHGAW